MGHRRLHGRSGERHGTQADGGRRSQRFRDTNPGSARCVLPSELACETRLHAAGRIIQYSQTAEPGPNVSTERSEPLYHDFHDQSLQADGRMSHIPNGPFVASSSSICYTAKWRRQHAGTLRCGKGTAWGQTMTRPAYNPGTIAGRAAVANRHPHPLYQPHYDRDFTSIGELFNIPLYGQMQAMAWLPNTAYPVGTVIVPPSGTAPGSGGMAFMCTTCWNERQHAAELAHDVGSADRRRNEHSGVAVDADRQHDSDSPRMPAPQNPMQTQMFTGLTHVMGSRFPESGTTVLPASPANPVRPELLVGATRCPTIRQS